MTGRGVTPNHPSPFFEEEGVTKLGVFYVQAVDKTTGIITGVFGIGSGVAYHFEANGVFPSLNILDNVDQKWIGIFCPALFLLETGIFDRDMAGVI